MMIAYIYTMALDLVGKIAVVIAALFAITALLPEFINGANGFDWGNVTVAGETKDYSYVPKLLVLGTMLALAFVGIRQITQAAKGMK